MIFLVLLLWLWSASIAYGLDTDSKKAIGQIKEVVGDVTVERGDNIYGVAAGDLLQVGDTIRTGITGTASVTLLDGARCSIGSRTRFRVNVYQWNPTTQEGRAQTNLSTGVVVFKTGKMSPKRGGGTFQIALPKGKLDLHGTMVAIEVNP